MNELIKTDYEKGVTPIATLKAQMGSLKQLYEEVLVPNVHYGVIPGCKKPSLWKPGSEMILTMFQLTVIPTVDEVMGNDAEERRFRAKVEISLRDGVVVGAGYGECSSYEEKYKWRKAVCDAEYESYPETHKRLKFLRSGEGIKQVRTEVADISNTVMKMAIKRAQIDAVLRCTAASALFDQDIEDMPEEVRSELLNNKPVKPQYYSKKPKSPTGKPAVSPANASKPCSPAQQNKIMQVANDKGVNVEPLFELHGKAKVEELTMSEASDVIETLMGM